MAVQQERHSSLDASQYSPSQHKKEMLESEGLDYDEKWIQRSILAEFSLGLIYASLLLVFL
jgi:hypothetical protein